MNKNKGFPFLRGGVRRGLLLLLMLLPLCGFAQTLTQYEYWFDDDFAGRRIASLSGKEKDLTVTIDTYFLETGLHRLNLRVKQSDGKYSAITTSSFLKVVMGEAKWLEYWFDGDETNKKRIAGTAASDGNGYVFNSEVDISELSVGNHQLYYRAVSDNGLISTAVSVSPFLKLVTGEAKWLEYWFDGDRANKKRIAGTKASDGNGYVFNNELDVSGLDPGHHRLYYRAVSDNGLVSTSVSTSSVVVKLLAEQAQMASDAKISGYRISVDGKNVETRRFSNPQLYWDLDEPLDARKYTTGNHSVKVTFWNTAGSSVSVEQPFEVLAPVTPTITLTAEEKNGVVNFKFNSVPNDLEYGLIRVDANGAKHKVDGKKYSVYPTTMSASDNPPAGSYTYYVAMLYRDASGTREKVQSNKVAVNIAKPQTEVEAAQEYGYITGSIVCDKNTTWKGLTVEVSGDATESLKVKNGIFNLQKIPVGMTLTLAVEGDKVHDYETKTLTIKAGENNVTINGTLREEYYPSNLENDLALKSGTYLETIQKDVNGKKYHAVKFSVKNLSAQNKWKGIVRVKAVNIDSRNISHLLKTNIYEGRTEAELELDGLETADLEIVIDKLNLKKDSRIDFYLESDGRWEGFDEANETKPIELVGYTKSPIRMTMAKMEEDALTKWDDEAKEDFAYLMLGLGSLTDGLDYVVGDFSPYLPTMQEFVKKYGHTTDVKAGIKKMVEWLSGKTALEALNELNAFNVTSSGVSLTKTLKNIVLPKSSILQKFKKDVIVKSSDIAEANAILGAVVGIAKAVGGSNDTFERAMNCASALYTICADVSVPVASMFYTYSVVGKSLINKALQIQGATHDLHLAARLNGNKVFTGEQTGANANRQNTAVDFKIVVNKKKGKPIDFTKTDAQSQIKNIYVVAKGAMSSAEHYFKRIYMKDGLMLRYDGKNGTLQEGFVLSQFYLVIEWNNKRKTFIPMIEACDGVAIDFSNLNQTDTFENYKPATYTVTLTTATGEDKMADELYLGKDTNRK